MTKSTIHASLQRVLNVAGCDMSEVATLLGVSLATVERWGRQGVSQTAATKLGLLLGIDPVWILTGDTKQKPKSSSAKRPIKHPNAKADSVPKEAVLEFIETENGALILREVGTKESLVTINFGDKVKDMVGEEYIQNVGQHMISAAIASVMERQMRQYHAHVYDETPKRFS